MKISKRQSNLFSKKRTEKKSELCSEPNANANTYPVDEIAPDDESPTNKNRNHHHGNTIKKPKLMKEFFRKKKQSQEEKRSVILEEPSTISEKLSTRPDDQSGQETDTHTVNSVDTTISTPEKVSDEVLLNMDSHSETVDAAHNEPPVESITTESSLSRILGCGGLIW